MRKTAISRDAHLSVITVVGDRPESNDGADSELAYRTAPASVSATRKGRKAFQTVESAVV